MSTFINRCLVTGASGFVGRSLCSRLRNAGVHVRGMARRPAEGPWDEFIHFDLRQPVLDPALLSGVDTVFHLAGRAHVDTDSEADVAAHRILNTEGTRTILQAALTAGVQRFIYFSSVKAVGDPGEHLIDETFDDAPSGAYGRSKRAAESLVLDDDVQRRMHVVVLRPSLVYGPHMKGNLYTMLESIRNRRFPPIPDVGNRRSMVHVDDVAAAAMLAAVSPQAQGRVFILTDGQAYSSRRIYVAMCCALGREPPPWHVPAAVLRAAAVTGDFARAVGIHGWPLDSSAYRRLMGSAWYDSTRIRDELGWSSDRILEDALSAIGAEAAPR